MYRLDRIAEGLLKPINPYVVVILGLLTTTWGLWMLSPAWNVFASAPQFTRMAAFAPEWAWGAWSTICGVMLIIAIFKGLYRCLVASLGFMSWHWATVAGMLWWGDWHNTGGLVYTYIAIYSIYCYLNMKTNHRPDSRF